MKLLANTYYSWLPEVQPGDLVKLHVDDGTIKGKVWVRVVLRTVEQPRGAILYAGILDQFTVLDIKPKQSFVFSPKQIHYVVGQNERWG